MFSANVSSFAGSPVDVRREEPRMDGLTFFSGSSVDMPQEFPVMLEKAEQLWATSEVRTLCACQGALLLGFSRPL